MLEGFTQAGLKLEFLKTSENPFLHSISWESIPEEVRPIKDQPFYHLLAENDEHSYVAYVSEQNLLVDDSGKPVSHPQVAEVFGPFRGSFYEAKMGRAH